MSKTKYAGAEWIRAALKVELSPLGIQVADLLGDVFCGIYHLDAGKLSKVDWQNNHFLSVQLIHSLATFDSEDLTKLVVLAHDRCLRLDIRAATVNTLELMFHQRKRTGGIGERMPTMEGHLAALRRYYPVEPEV